jgi:hypothetical protein
MNARRSIDDYPKFMDSHQVAERPGHPVKQIQVWSRERRIPAHREPGARRWWFDRNELLMWLRAETRVTLVAHGR